MERQQTVCKVSAGGAEAEARSAAARLAEAQARGSTLARQLETERQQGAAVAGALRDELQGIKVGERGGRVHSGTRRRETHTHFEMWTDIPYLW